MFLIDAGEGRDGGECARVRAARRTHMYGELESAVHVQCTRRGLSKGLVQHSSLYGLVGFGPRLGMQGAWLGMGGGGGEFQGLQGRCGL
jgi:hypothetical protein